MGRFFSSVRLCDRTAAFALLAVAAASLTFVASGVPLLRHDWFPIVPSLRFALQNATGWDPTGMGSVVGYPASFLLVFLRSAVAAVAGSYSAHIAYFAAYSFLVVFGAARLCRVLGGSRLARVGSALFAAFNPWTYVELVAGHGFVLLSYAATFWLIAECCTRSRSRLRLVLLTIAVAPQIQFLLIDAVLYAWLSFRMRSSLVLLAIAAMLLPVIVGIVTSRHVLLGIPLTLEWERGQSLDPLRACILRGYFTSYDSALAGFYEWAQWLVLAIVCIGVLTILAYRRRYAWLIAFTAIPLFWSFGTIGPLRVFFAWAIYAIPETGLFRELYGLLGFVAVGYVAFIAIAAARWRGLDALVVVAGAAMLTAWTMSPPDRYWVTKHDLPATTIAGTPNMRFLLMPALYPARLGSRGSGGDPDLYSRANGVTPVNEGTPMYPLSPALGRFMRDGSTRDLAALSVEHVFARPWLRTDPAIEPQLALPIPSWFRESPARSTSIARALPELSLAAPPAVGTLDTNIGAGNVFFGDARDATGAVPEAWRAFAPVRLASTPNTFVRAEEGWVDARLAFVEDPDLGQPFGGALTTNRTALLAVAPNAFALVYVRGSLLARNGEPLTRTTVGYRWVFVPRDTTALACAGLCVVAAQAARVPDAPLYPATVPSRGIAFHAPLPWLVLATLPAGRDELLRYNATFDSKWTAWFGGAVLPHVRVDGAVNGWLVPARSRPMRAVLVETGAFGTTLSEVVSVALLCFAIGYALRMRSSKDERPGVARADTV